MRSNRSVAKILEGLNYHTDYGQMIRDTIAVWASVSVCIWIGAPLWVTIPVAWFASVLGRK